MGTTEEKRYRTIHPSQLLRWINDPSAIIRLRTHRDVLPSGYLAAMMPMLVDWKASDIHRADPLVVLRNVNYGGNPLERTTVLQSVRLSLDSVAYAEYTLVPLTPIGRRSLVQHGHLRFVFEPDRRPQLLHFRDESDGAEPKLDDLVLSYEPWRPAKEHFSFTRALRGDFGLSLRAYAGAQRFIEDAVAGHDWYSYRLKLPGGRQGLRELLEMALALGDGLARNLIGRMLQVSDAKWRENLPSAGEEEETLRRQRGALKEWVEYSEMPTALPALEEHDQSYQTLVRSCASMARYTTLLAAHRLVDRGLTDGVNLDRLPPAAIGEVQPWMREIGSADLRGVFLRAPSAVRYLLSHPSTVPKNIPAELDAAGLLQRRGGKRLELHFSTRGAQPYGSLGVRDLRQR